MRPIFARGYYVEIVRLAMKPQDIVWNNVFPFKARRAFVRTLTFFIISVFLGLVSRVGTATGGKAGPDSLIELKTAETVHRGRAIALSEQACWLMGRDARIRRVPLSRIEQQRVLSPRFRYYSAVEMRDLLREEFGRDFEVTGTTHYLVCAPRNQADEYAQLFEGVFRSFYGFFPDAVSAWPNRSLRSLPSSSRGARVLLNIAGRTACVRFPV